MRFENSKIEILICPLILLIKKNIRIIYRCVFTFFNGPTKKGHIEKQGQKAFPLSAYYDGPW